MKKATLDLIENLKILHHFFGWDYEGVCHASEAEAEAYSLAAAKIIWEIEQGESTLCKILKRVGWLNYFEHQERDENDFWALIIAYWYEKTVARRASEPLVRNLPSPSLHLSLWMRAHTYTKKVQKRLENEIQRPPPKIFLPIPNKIEIGGCSRSDSLIAPLLN